MISLAPWSWTYSAFGVDTQVKAFVELAGSLLSAGAPKPAGSQQRSQTQGLSGEMLRSMRFAGVISALIGAMELLDADHPQVCACTGLLAGMQTHMAVSS